MSLIGKEIGDFSVEAYPPAITENIDNIWH